MTSDLWRDFPTFRVCTAPPGTADWFVACRGLFTAGKFDQVCPGAAFPLQPRQKQSAAMAYGVRTEPAVRDWYKEDTGLQVEELGLAVPKWELRIGGASDGYIASSPDGPGIIEIKCPRAMYQPLVRHLQELEEGKVFPSGYHEHIWRSHYSQMQGCMKILAVQWCDYIVYCEPQMYVERVPFNAEYWDTFLAVYIEKHLAEKASKGV